MKKRHSIHLLLAAAALLLATAACTKDELADGDRLPEGQYPVEIARITLGVEGGEAQPWGTPQTRVSENGDGKSSTFDAGDRFAVQIDGQGRGSHRHRLVPRHGRHPRPRRPKPKSCLPAGQLGHGRLPETRHADLHPPTGQGARHAFGRCTRRSAEPPALYLYTVYL